ncbi:MAG: OmpA family protein [bacterium]|nr:OmpA family protein [bacterium]
MKKLSLSLFSICLLALFGCTSDIDDVPVSSNDLIDQNVVYKSETVKVDVEEVQAPANDFSKTEVAKTETFETKKEVEVIVPPQATESENVDFVDAYYIERNPEDVEFEMAVAQAEARRGIRPSQKRTYVPVKPAPEIMPMTQDAPMPVSVPQEKRKLNVKDIEPVRNITFLSTIVYHSNTKADISEKDLKALKNVAKLAREKNAFVRVVGNASSRSKDMKEVQNKIENFDLSLLRAQKVSDALVKFGVPKDRIFIVAAADTEKVVEENMPINEAINRRTEIYLNY